MIRLLADENLNLSIVRGVLRRVPGLDIVRVQDVGLTGTDDPALLAWAAAERRVLLTHDVATITRYAWQRVEQDLPMPGVIEVQMFAGVGDVIEDLVLIIECCDAAELNRRVLYVPL